MPEGASARGLRTALTDLDPASAAWVRGLSSGGGERDRTIELLHPVLLRIARGEAARRSASSGIAGQELDDLAHQAAADALLSILRRIEDFRGESRFTTWAYKFVVLEVASKLGRHAWRRSGGPIAGEDWDQLPARLGADPEDAVVLSELVQTVRHAVDHELTAHQRRVFVAVVLHATPLDALVAELGSSRNAVYKTMFDARRKLRAYLIARGQIDIDPRGAA